ncbi:Uu.00g034730.m01.CDS01 [Anthostomella pinea]|uniref:Uu.00g034730.m01.CDS01 n=1 Tax=Anthostomella pinea TaxID=933095 RepID=A0AAI8VA39_9PEZI|nr:Uu.00g034730.m01.CDS01 [Anthostomella pinea]
MAQTVLFSQALEAAMDLGNIDVGLEVGPHAALRGPALQTTKQVSGSEIPYVGALDRKKNEVAALSDALGSIWTSLGPSAVDLARYTSAFTQDGRPLSFQPLGSLPTYPFDHQTIFFRESRINKQFRLRSDPPHELLGTRTPDCTAWEPRWRNFFKTEMSWLKGHRIQGQIVVPGATYCVMALEAAKALCKGKNTSRFELRNIKILRPISLDESSEGVETLFSLRSDIDSLKGGEGLVHADFSLSAANVSDGNMRMICSGEIRIHLGEPDSTAFPTRPLQPRTELLSMNVDRFYSALDRLGLNYSETSEV